MCLSLLAGCGSSSSSSGSSDSNSDDDSSAASTSEDAGGSETAETEAAETDGYIIDELTVSCSSDGGTFDPYTRGGWGKMAVGDLIFQYLGDLDNEGTVHWTIAKSVEAEDDGLTSMDEPYYEPKLIAPDTWQIMSSGDYHYLLVGDEEGISIDTGYGAGNLREYLEGLCGKPPSGCKTEAAGLRIPKSVSAWATSSSVGVRTPSSG